MSTPADWGVDLKPGQSVRVTSKAGPRFVAEFVIERVDFDGELFAQGADSVSGIFPSGYTVEVLPEPLPTEPGYYLDREDDLWVITGEGAGLRLLPHSGIEDGGDAERYQPFRRLLPAS